MNSRTTSKKPQSNDIVQINTQDLKVVYAALGKIIGDSENLMPDDKKLKGKRRKFHGKSTKARPVVQLNAVTRKAIATFPSIAEASRVTYVSSCSISNGCNESVIKKGFYWEYL